MADHKIPNPPAEVGGSFREAGNTFREAGNTFREAVCIDVKKIYDTCADRDCLEDVRVYFTDSAQPFVDQAVSVRCRKCEIMNCFTDVEAVQFNRGYYSVDMTFCFRVMIDCFTCPSAAPYTADGLCVFQKKCILYGSEGNVKVYSSEYAQDEPDDQFLPRTTNPIAKVQAVDPVILATRICDICNCTDNNCCCAPARVCGAFQGSFENPNPQKAVYVSLGLFTVVELERDVQILIPAYDFCVPDKECTYSITNDDPCDAFKKIRFPHDEFYPRDEGKERCSCGDKF